MATGLALHRRARVVMAASGLLALGAVVLLLQPALDRVLFLQWNALAPRWGGLGTLLSLLGLGASVLLGGALLGPGHARTLAAIVLLLVLGGLLVQGAKTAVGLPRPVAVLEAGQIEVLGLAIRSRSMPSGHAALWAGLLALGLCAPRRSWQLAQAWERRALLALLAACALAGALARVVVGAHWPSDIAAGFALGLLTGAWIGGSLLGRRLTRGLAALMRTQAGSRVTAALVVAVAGGLWVTEREYPQVALLYLLLAALGALAAWRWWRLHPGPGLGPWPRRRPT